MKPETAKIIEQVEKDGERLKAFLRNVRTKIGNPEGYTPQDIEELLAEAEQVCG